MNTSRLHAIEARDPDSQRIKVAINTPKGGRNKYEYDVALGRLRGRPVLP
jgi:inorganic pyrophosphatase